MTNVCIVLLIFFHYSSLFSYSDESVNFEIQKGLSGSRSKIVFFKHNDMNHLESLLEEQNKIDKKVSQYTIYHAGFHAGMFLSGGITEDCVKVNYHRGGEGMAPMKVFKSRLSEVASGGFWDL